MSEYQLRHFYASVGLQYASPSWRHIANTYATANANAQNYNWYPVNNWCPVNEYKIAEALEQYLYAGNGALGR